MKGDELLDVGLDKAGTVSYKNMCAVSQNGFSPVK